MSTHPTQATRANRTQTNRRADRHAPRFLDSVGLIAGREITMRLRSKAFLVVDGVLMLAVLASVVLGSIFGAQESTTKVAVVAGASAVVDGNPELEPVAASDQDDAERMLRAGEVDAIVAPAASEPLGITVIGLDAPPDSVVVGARRCTHRGAARAGRDRPRARLPGGLRLRPRVLHVGDHVRHHDRAVGRRGEADAHRRDPAVDGVGAGLLTGKVIGNSVMAMAQIVAIAVLAILGLLVTGQRCCWAASARR